MPRGRNYWVDADTARRMEWLRDLLAETNGIKPTWVQVISYAVNLAIVAAEPKEMQEAK